MSPVDVRVQAIRAEIERDWGYVREQLSRAQSVDPSSSGPEAAYVALALDHAYQAFEEILLGIERALVLPQRQGDSWHRALLADGALPIPSVRPAVYPASVEGDWGHVLGFRHFLRHAYGADLDPDRLKENVARLAGAVEATDATLRDLLAALTED